jgi:hypothetical protein
VRGVSCSERFEREAVAAELAKERERHLAPLGYPIEVGDSRVTRSAFRFCPRADSTPDMDTRAAITVLRGRDEVSRLWGERLEGATVTFKDAPGDRGTEVHVDLGEERHGPARRLGRSGELAKVKDELRRFKQRAETGVVPRSDAAPEGERFARKLKQRPAQPVGTP